VQEAAAETASNKGGFSLPFDRIRGGGKKVSGGKKVAETDGMKKRREKGESKGESCRGQGARSPPEESMPRTLPEVEYRKKRRFQKKGICGKAEWEGGEGKEMVILRGQKKETEGGGKGGGEREGKKKKSIRAGARIQNCGKGRQLQLSSKRVSACSMKLSQGVKEESLKRRRKITKSRGKA